MSEEFEKISKSEELAVAVMEGALEKHPEWKEALENADSMEACRECVELALALRQEEGIPALDVEKELQAFHRKREWERKRAFRRWENIGIGIAALFILCFFVHLLLRPMQPVHKGVLVFQADTTSRHISLQVAGDEVKPLYEVENETLPAMAILPGEIHYTKEKIDKAIEEKRIREHRLCIPRGEMFKVVLSDSTEVFLNADSRLTYPMVFMGKERVVSLEGEAYFKVYKDVKHPFIVRSGGLRTMVLGTEFAVRHYEGEETRVTLIEGKVAVSDTCGIEAIEMKPGESAALLADGSFQVAQVDLEPYIYWMEGYFYFDHVCLADMMREIGRWYNVDVEFRNQKAMDLQIHFLADRRQDIHHTLELLNRMEKVQAVYQAGKVIIY